MAQPPQRISVHYLKSEFFRECHVDGVIGGATPQGNVWIGVYSERMPVPLEAVHDLKPVDGSIATFELGRVLQEGTKTKEGVIRTLEAGIHLDMNAAKALHEWLGRVIREEQGASR